MSIPPKTQDPQYIELLTKDDQEQFHLLQRDINSIVLKNGRSKFCSIFSEIVKKIKSFVVRNDSGDNARSLVCGIVWMDEIIAINTRQLIHTINKCKSSINSGFQAIGYTTVQMDPETAVNFVHRFPFMKENFCETRQWTLRKLCSSPKQSCQKEVKAKQIVMPNINQNSTETEKEANKLPATDKKLTIEVNFEPVNLFDFQYQGIGDSHLTDMFDDISDPATPFDNKEFITLI